MDSKCVQPRTEKETDVGKLSSLLVIVATAALGVRMAAGTTEPGVLDNLPGLRLSCLLSDLSTGLVVPHEGALL